MKERLRILTTRSAAVALAMLAVMSLGIGLMMRVFFDFQRTIIEQEEHQMLTVSKSVASSIAIYINGYLSDMIVLRSSPDFVEGMRIYRDTGNTAPLVSCMTAYANIRPSLVTGLCLLDNDDGFLAGTVGALQYVGYPPEHTSTQMLYFKNEQGSYCIGIALPVYQQSWLVCLLNISDMYQRIGSDVRLGRNGYVAITASNGLVLMHPESRLQGKDLLESLAPRYVQQQSLDTLKSLLAQQRQATTGVRFYDSPEYERSPWYGERPVQKVVAYTPAWLRDDFLMVSAVSDYADILAPMHRSMARMLFYVVLVLFGALGLLTAIFYLVHSRRSYAEENRALREVNSSLEELHEREEQILHSQRLQTIGTLTGGIAHEFSNLLTPIMGYSGMMLETLPKDDDNYEDVQQIYQCSERAKEIIQQITTLSRKNVEHTFELLPLEKLSQRFVRIARSTLPENVQLETAFAPSPAGILGNESQLSQVVLNLCANAFQAIGDRADGRLLLSSVLLRREQLPGELFGEGGYERYAAFSFADNGAGIEQRLCERIFEPFFTTKKAGQGTGLGLSIAQTIAESHSGRLTVQSEAGRGSVFTLYLPISRENVQQRPAPLAPDAQAAPVVLVDNNPRLLNLLKTTLEADGFAVTAFERPSEAESYLRDHFAAALVTDYSMPQILGTHLAVLARGASPSVKVLLLTSVVAREIVESKHKGIIDDYLLKPVAGALVSRRLYELLGGTGEEATP